MSLDTVSRSSLPFNPFDMIPDELLNPIASYVQNPLRLALVSKQMHFFATRSLAEDILENLEKGIGTIQSKLLMNRVTTPDQTPYQKVKAIFLDLRHRYELRITIARQVDIYRPPKEGLIVSPSDYRSICTWMNEMNLLPIENFIRMRTASPSFCNLRALDAKQLFIQHFTDNADHDFLNFCQRLCNSVPLEEHLKNLVAPPGMVFETNMFKRTIENTIMGRKLLRDHLLKFPELNPFTLLEREELVIDSPPHTLNIPKEILLLQNLKRLTVCGNLEGNITERIKEVPVWIGKLQSLTALDLRCNSLVTLPDSLGSLKSLTSLDASKNSISVIPPQIGQLPKLTDLNLSDNYIDDLPETFNELNYLKILNLSLNFFSRVPQSILDLDLVVLDLSNNRITEIEGLAKLKKLTLRNNPITFIDVNNGALHALQYLDVSGDLTQDPISPGFELLLLRHSIYLTPPKSKLPYERVKAKSTCEFDLSKGVFHLPNLTVLDLSNLKLKEIPFEIRNLRKLKKLFLNGNNLTALTPAIGCLTDLSELNLSNNSLRKLPGSFANLKLTSLYLGFNAEFITPPDRRVNPSRTITTSYRSSLGRVELHEEKFEKKEEQKG